MKPLNPCYDPVNKRDCPHRSVNCRVSCPLWKEYEEKRDAEYERRRADTDFTEGFNENVKRRLRYLVKKERWR